jgi:hypothetical protein
MRMLALSRLCTLAACSPKPPESSYTTNGTKSERVASISKLLSKTASLPSSLLNAYFIQEQTGDGRVGPSGFEAFYALSVDPVNLPAWQAELSKSKPLMFPC